MPLFEKHLELGPPLALSAWRKIAIGTWRNAKDPSVYGMLDLNAAAALVFLEQEGARLGRRLSMTHFVSRVLAIALVRHPDINCVLRFGRLYPRKSVTLFLQVATDDAGRDLSGMTIGHAETKDIGAIAAELQRAAECIRTHTDPTYRRMKSLFHFLPGWCAQFVLSFAGFCQYQLNLWSPLFGTPKDSLGSVMITNVGSLGLDTAFAPLVPYSHVPMVIAIGKVTDRAIVHNGQIVVAPMLRLGVTFDHRLIDGVHAAKLAKTVEALFASPSKVQMAASPLF